MPESNMSERDMSGFLEIADLINRAGDQLGLDRIQLDKERGFLQALLPKLGGFPPRAFVLFCQSHEITVSVRNVAWTGSAMSPDNRAMELFVSRKSHEGLSRDEAMHMSLHLESWLSMDRSGDDVVRLAALASNSHARYSFACHDHRDGELYVQAQQRFHSVIPEEIVGLAESVISHASGLAYFLRQLPPAATTSRPDDLIELALRTHLESKSTDRNDSDQVAEELEHDEWL